MTSAVADVIAQDAGVTLSNAPHGLPPAGSLRLAERARCFWSCSFCLLFFQFCARYFAVAGRAAVPDSGLDCFGACCSAISGAVADTAVAEVLAVVDSVVGAAGLVDSVVEAQAVAGRSAVTRE